jgi:fumarate reductase (fragment)
MDKNISFTLKVRLQNGPKAKGHFDTFEMRDNAQAKGKGLK